MVEHGAAISCCHRSLDACTAAGDASAGGLGGGRGGLCRRSQAYLPRRDLPFPNVSRPAEAPAGQSVMRHQSTID